MDSFKEQIVRKHTSQKDSVTKLFTMIASVALAFGIVFLVIAFLPKYTILGLFLGIMAIYGGVYFVQNLNVEYEYIFTNGDLDIDKIIAQRNRKRLATIKVNNATAVGQVGSDFSVSSSRTLVYASACNPDAQDYYIDVNHKSLGEVTLVFTPDSDMLELIKTHLPRNLRANIVIPINSQEKEDTNE